MQQTASPSVAIVIVNYNGRDDTLECLASVDRLRYRNYSVLVIDQRSQDGSADALRAAYPEIEVIENDRNNGFAAGNNIGVRLALTRGADFVLLLNNDTTVPRELLGNLISAAESAPDAGIIGPVMCYYDSPDVVWSAGGSIGHLGESRMLAQGRRRGEIRSGFGGGRLVDVDFVVGCGMLIRRRVFEQVGMMDERYFLYYEETDFCLAAKRAGWRIASDTSSVMWHKVSRSTGTDSNLTLYYMRRNVLLFLEKSVPGSLATRISVVVENLRLAVVWTVRGQHARALTVVRATIDYIRRKFGRNDWAHNS